MAMTVAEDRNGNGEGGIEREGRRSFKNISRIKLKTCHDDYISIGSDGTLALIF